MLASLAGSREGDRRRPRRRPVPTGARARPRRSVRAGQHHRARGRPLGIDRRRRGHGFLDRGGRRPISRAGRAWREPTVGVLRPGEVLLAGRPGARRVPRGVPRRGSKFRGVHDRDVGSLPHAVRRCRWSTRWSGPHPIAVPAGSGSTVRRSRGAGGRPGIPSADRDVAGGSSMEVEEDMRRHGALVSEAMKGGECTLVSGATMQGASAIAGEVAERTKGIRAVGYLPAAVPPDVQVDAERYAVIRSDRRRGLQRRGTAALLGGHHGGGESLPPTCGSLRSAADASPKPSTGWRSRSALGSVRSAAAAAPRPRCSGTHGGPPPRSDPRSLRMSLRSAGSLPSTSDRGVC